MKVYYQSCVFKRPETTDSSYKPRLLCPPTKGVSNVKPALYNPKCLIPINYQYGNKQTSQLPYIYKSGYAHKIRAYSRSIYPPSTANTTHTKFQATKVRYDIPQFVQYPKEKLNTSESKETENNVHNVVKPGTAIAMSRPCQPRVCSASVRGKRPDTRYKKETLFHKLELGNCVKKQEYYIPFLDWGDDPHNKDKLPECWRDDNFRNKELY